MAALLKVPPEQIVGHLMRVWVWADQQSVNVDACGDAFVDVELSTLDAVAHLPGFGEALRAVKWVKEERGRLIFPSLQSYISESAKIRALKNRSQQKYRAKVDGPPSTNEPPREEVEKSSKPTPLPPRPAGEGNPGKTKAKAKTRGNGSGRWWLTEQGVEAKARELGLWPARVGESAEAFKERVSAADRKAHSNESS